MKLPEEIKANFIIEIQAQVTMNFETGKIEPISDVLLELKSLIEKHPQVFKSIEIYPEDHL